MSLNKKIASVKCRVTLRQIVDRSNIEAPGLYWGNGLIEVTAHLPDKSTIDLVVDPEAYNAEDPKRCFDPALNEWSQWRIASVIVDQRKQLN